MRYRSGSSLAQTYNLFFWWIQGYVGEGNGDPLQYSCLENPMGGGAWGAAVHGVAKSRTRLSEFTFTFMHWRRKWQPTPVFLPGESQGSRTWRAAIYGVAQSRTRLTQLSSSSKMAMYVVFLCSFRAFLATQNAVHRNATEVSLRSFLEVLLPCTV